MRVTQNMLSTQVIRNIQTNYRAMSKYQEQVSSGKAINRVSDDPVKSVQIMSHRSALMETEQFKRNAEDGLTWLETTDRSLDDLTQVMQKVRELTVQGSNGVNNKDSLETIAMELKALKGNIGDIANARLGDRYLFAGTATDTAPFENGEFVSKNGDSLSWNVGQGIYMKVNVNGSDIFNFQSGGLNLLETVGKIAGELESGNDPQQYLDHLDKQMSNLLAQRSIVGSNVNQLEMMVNRLDQTMLSTKSMLSKTEDADLAEIITNFTTQQTILNAALSSGAKAIQPTLVDFLR
ncbi:flagellar hook-associated protein 3 [Neobacillus bataviensis LMG 21833]|uniref:Flagellar hook-associated protein 3 n=1 Tax=Neobacillus bataviensis LMG 21833 TaxID=1117379 RepID=K6C0N6_9BACI|nr:flagellar hook-associated protein FlgL [Neobacillus bataviensis]EKN64725.1 flagellar hook-associated protein 3 [Neobacillus bataviensis LMG 21833]